MMLLPASALALTAAALPPEEIVASGPNGDLKGTFVKAANPTAPVVLIIPGSGPTDRDGNSPLGINAGSYRLLAEQLRLEGVSTVRFDKRGMFASARAVPAANAVTVNDYVKDTHAWVSAIRDATGADCVWLLGHSEGGLVALAAAQEEPAICGLILVATAGRPLGEVLKEQLRSNPSNVSLLTQADAVIDALTAGSRVANAELTAPLAALFAPAIQGFLISAFSLDPAKLAKQSSKPILILQGESDLQVSIADAEALKMAAPSAKLVRLPNTNHVLKIVASDDRAANIATYADPSLPLAPDIAEEIQKFVNLHSRE